MNRQIRFGTKNCVVIFMQQSPGLLAEYIRYFLIDSGYSLLDSDHSLVESSNLTVDFCFQVSDSLRQTMVTKEAYCPDIKPEDLKAANATLLCDSTRDFYSMQYSLVVNILIVFLGALCFFITAIWIIKDKERVERFVAGNKSVDIIK